MRVRAFHLSVRLSVCSPVVVTLTLSTSTIIVSSLFKPPLDKRFLSRCSGVPNWFRQFAVLNEQRPEAHFVSRLKRKRVK